MIRDCHIHIKTGCCLSFELICPKDILTAKHVSNSSIIPLKITFNKLLLWCIDSLWLIRKISLIYFGVSQTLQQCNVQDVQLPAGHWPSVPSFPSIVQLTSLGSQPPGALLFELPVVGKKIIRALKPVQE